MLHPGHRHRGRAARRLCALIVVSALAGCSSDDGDAGLQTATGCVESELIAQCPPGSSPLLGAGAEQTCEAAGGFDVVGQEGEVTGRCAAVGTCTVLCQFDTPCPCGVASVTRVEGVTCASCVGAASCGDDVCEGGESFSTCPRDCGGECTPGAERCAALDRQQCSLNGRWETLACPAGQVCVEAAGVTRCQRDDLVTPDVSGDAETDTGPVVAGRILFGPAPYVDDAGVAGGGDGLSLAEAATVRSYGLICPAPPNSTQACNDSLASYPIGAALHPSQAHIPYGSLDWETLWGPGPDPDGPLLVLGGERWGWAWPDGQGAAVSDAAPTAEGYCQRQADCGGGAGCEPPLDPGVQAALDDALGVLGPAGVACLLEGDPIDCQRSRVTCMGAGVGATLYDLEDEAAVVAPRDARWAPGGDAAYAMADQRRTQDQGVGRAIYRIDALSGVAARIADTGAYYGAVLDASAGGGHLAMGIWDGVVDQHPFDGTWRFTYGQPLVRVVDLASGAIEDVVLSDAALPSHGRIIDVALSPNAALVAVSRQATHANPSSYGVDLHNVADGRLIYRILPPEAGACGAGDGAVSDVAFLPDGDHLLVRAEGCGAVSYEVWRTSTGEQVSVLTLPRAVWPEAVTVTPDGQSLVVAGQAEYGVVGPLLVDVYDLFTGDRARGLSVDLGDLILSLPYSLRFHPDGTRLVGQWSSWSASDPRAAFSVITLEAP